MIVVDVGCYTHVIDGKVYASIPALAERFKPDLIYGFDPWPEMRDYEARVGTAKVTVRRAAAWVETGVIEFVPHNLGATVMREKDTRGEWRHHQMLSVRCFDFNAWLRTLPEKPVVKLDCEGAEFPLLERLIEQEHDALVELVLVEWHDDQMSGDWTRRRESIIDRIACPIEAWDE